MIRLYGYWRSSAAYRVRIALNLKGLEYEQAAVHLVRDGGEQRKPEYLALNPQGRVPLLEHDGVYLSQSLAIIEYLDEMFEQPPLLPSDAHGRARVRSLAQLVACDMHPLNNLGVLTYLKSELGADEEKVKDWYRHWIEVGFAALERRLESEDATGDYCHGARPGIADLCLVPQVYNARRFNVDMSGYPRIADIDAACMTLSAFQQAAPERQPDAN
ncbi:MAG: maleylacetoacetate isomerase [Gammaproteobacteria bacterium]|nr:maleylacetoacetate isomerase [Gammaproteobacteria bacterium]